MLKEIYFAGGCFWGTQHLFSLVDGVQKATSGYANGHTQNPSYEEVCKGNTGHRECVKVIYDDEKVKLSELIRLYFSSIDPTQINRQGNDKGSQYQTGIYFTDSESEKTVKRLANDESLKHESFNVEIQPLSCFYDAEEYHQAYLDKNPRGYCHVSPALFQRAKALGTPKYNDNRAIYREIEPEVAANMKEEDHSVMFLDVRAVDEYRQGHIHDAVNIPLDRLDTLYHVKLLDKDMPIIVYCYSGGRSSMAAQFLVSKGYTNVHDLGGILFWPYKVEK